MGYDTADDAAVYLLSPDSALIQTVDFFPPMVDDPYLFGQVAAANALSDVYAMGGTPRLAMNLLCFPSALLPTEDVRAILAGGADKVAEAGALLCGGHTIEDKEPKYGLCVTGFVHPDRLRTNADAQTGDLLILTKPLGSGVLATAAKSGMLTAAQTEGLMRTMTALNAKAADIMGRYPAHACTDITGFGLAGHATEMAKASRKSIRLYSGRLPLLDGALDMARQGIVPGGAFRNRDYLLPTTSVRAGLDEHLSLLMFDPQTSGGLLISISEKHAEAMLEELRPYCPQACIVGEVMEPMDKHIIIA